MRALKPRKIQPCSHQTLRKIQMRCQTALLFQARHNMRRHPSDPLRACIPPAIDRLPALHRHDQAAMPQHIHQAAFRHVSQPGHLRLHACAIEHDDAGQPDGQLLDPEVKV